LVINVAEPASYSVHLTELICEVHPERVNRATVPCVENLDPVGATIVGGGDRG
jgi:hypothetical protein